MTEQQNRYENGLTDAAGWLASGRATAEEIAGFATAWDHETNLRIRVRDNHSLTGYLDQDRGPRTIPWQTVIVINPFTPYGRGFFEQLRTEHPARFRFSDDPVDSDA